MAWTCIVTWASLPNAPQESDRDRREEEVPLLPPATEEPCFLLGAPPLHIYCCGLHVPPPFLYCPNYLSFETLRGNRSAKRAALVSHPSRRFPPWPPTGSVAELHKQRGLSAFPDALVP